MKTLRDQFAMAAMQGLLASGDSWSYNDISHDAYSIADAMLAEREKNSLENAQSIKQMLVNEINKKHPGIGASVELSAEHLVQQLITGLPF